MRTTHSTRDNHAGRCFAILCWKRLPHRLAGRTGATEISATSLLQSWNRGRVRRACALNGQLIEASAGAPMITIAAASQGLPLRMRRETFPAPAHINCCTIERQDRGFAAQLVCYTARGRVAESGNGALASWNARTTVARYRWRYIISHLECATRHPIVGTPLSCTSLSYRVASTPQTVPQEC